MPSGRSESDKNSDMADNDWKARLGMVYSTDPDFEYDTGAEPEIGRASCRERV